MKTNATSEPARVRLTADYLDLDIGLAHRAGTILERTYSGQYALPGAVVGTWCISHFKRIEGICVPVE